MLKSHQAPSDGDVTADSSKLDCRLLLYLTSIITLAQQEKIEMDDGLKHRRHGTMTTTLSFTVSSTCRVRPDRGYATDLIHPLSILTQIAHQSPATTSTPPPWHRPSAISPVTT